LQDYKYLNLSARNTFFPHPESRKFYVTCLILVTDQILRRVTSDAFLKPMFNGHRNCSFTLKTTHVS